MERLGFQHTYDADGNLLTSTSYADASTSYTRRATSTTGGTGRPTCSSPADVVTHYEYDNLGRTLLDQDLRQRRLHALDRRTPRRDAEPLRRPRPRLRVARLRGRSATQSRHGGRLPAEPNTGTTPPGQVVKTATATGSSRSTPTTAWAGWSTSYTCFDTDETAYADADDVTGDTVIEQSQTWYDQAGQAVATATYQRLPDDTSTAGALDGRQQLRHRLGRLVRWAGPHRRHGQLRPRGRGFRPDALLLRRHSGTDAGGAYSAGDCRRDRNGIPDVAEAAPPATELLRQLHRRT